MSLSLVLKVITSHNSLLEPGFFDFHQCSFENITSSSRGGAFCLSHFESRVKVTECGFYRCITTFYTYSAGGFSLMYGSDCFMTKTCFYQCMGQSDTSAFQIGCDSKNSNFYCDYGSLTKPFSDPYSTKVNFLIAGTTSLLFTKSNVSKGNYNSDCFRVSNPKYGIVMTYTVFDSISSPIFFYMYVSTISEISMNNLVLINSETPQFGFFSSSTTVVFNDCFFNTSHQISNPSYINYIGKFVFNNCYIRYQPSNTSYLTFNGCKVIDSDSKIGVTYGVNTNDCWNIGIFNNIKPSMAHLSKNKYLYHLFIVMYV